MAIGDIVTAITDVATATDLDFQPSSGVEVMLTHLLSNAGSSADSLAATDGTNEAIYVVDVGSDGLTAKSLKWGITNSVYLRQSHTVGSNRFLGYSGVQVK